MQILPKTGLLRQKPELGSWSTQFMYSAGSACLPALVQALDSATSSDHKALMQSLTQSYWMQSTLSAVDNYRFGSKSMWHMLRWVGQLYLQGDVPVCPGAWHTGTLQPWQEAWAHGKANWSCMWQTRCCQSFPSWHISSLHDCLPKCAKMKFERGRINHAMFLAGDELGQQTCAVWLLRS